MRERLRQLTGGAPLFPLAILFGLNLVDELDTSAFNVLLPEVREWFGVSLTTVLAASSAAAIFGFLFAIPLGFAADRWPRVRIVAVAAFVWAFFSAGTALAPTIMLLYAARFGSRMGKTLDPVYSSLLADWYAPRVRGGIFAVHTMANSVGRFIAPLLAGFLAAWAFWQLPFFLFAVPSLVLGVIALVRLREPVRGEQERRAAGASDDVALMADKPPGLAESWRIARNVRTLRRIWVSLPFFAGALQALLTLLPLYFDEVFGVGPRGRGLIGAFDEVFRVIGLIAGGLLANRFLRRHPGRVLGFAGLLLAIVSGSVALLAVAPVLPVAIGLGYVQALAGAVLAPAATSVITLVVPPRARGFALSVGVIFTIPGLLLAPLVGPIADDHGMRAAMLVIAPVLLVGALILATSGRGVEPDMRQALAAAMALARREETRRSGEAALLVCRDIDVHYDGVQVLFGVDFEVAEGEIVALLGTNGAGKSTLLRAISGLTEPSNGAVFFDGGDITYLPAAEHAAKGIVSVPGGRGVFPNLTVEENLRLGGWLHRRDAETASAAVERVLEYFPLLRERFDQPAGNLSGGEQQMLTLGQAFLSRPRLLMVDELSLGLAPAVVEQLLGIVRAIHAQGTTVVLVEQSVNLALTLAERAVFMEKGEVRFTGPTVELLRRPELLRSVFLRSSASAGPGAYQGTRRRDFYARPDDREGPVLEVRGIRKSYGGVAALDGVDLDLDEGAIVGVIGPNGAGKTTLFDVISGFVEADAGHVRLLGQDVVGLGPDERARLGMHRSFQDARLFPALTVAENIACAMDRHLATRSATMAALRLPNVGRAERRVEERADRLVRLMGLTAFRDKFVRELSTGTRRVVDLSWALASNPTVLLLDEPSAGMAQRETEELAPLLQRIKYETGCSMLVIEHDIPLVSSLADELIAMDLGAVIARGRPADVLTDERVVKSYLGVIDPSTLGASRER